MYKFLVLINKKAFFIFLVSFLPIKENNREQREQRNDQLIGDYCAYLTKDDVRARIIPAFKTQGQSHPMSETEGIRGSLV